MGLGVGSGSVALWVDRPQCPSPKGLLGGSLHGREQMPLVKLVPHHAVEEV